MIEDRAMQVLRNLPKMAVATYRHQKEVALDNLMDRAVKAIQIVSRIETAKSGRRSKIDKYMIEAWHIYRKLLSMYATIPQKFSDNTHHYPLRTKSMPEKGMARVNWNSLAAPPKDHKQYDPYWNEKEAKKVRPVKVYTKEEREKIWKSQEKT